MSLRGRAEFHRVLTSGARARAGAVAVAVLPSPHGDAVSRVGLAVRASSGSVARNRIRRRLKEAFRAADLPGRDVVIRADERALAAGFQELVEALQAAVRRAEERV